MSQQFDFDREFDENVYDKEYYEGDGHKSGYKSYTDACGIVQDQFDIIDRIMRGRANWSTHLDVGCAYGYGVMRMRQLGWDSMGIDVSPYAIERAEELAEGILPPIFAVKNAIHELMDGHFSLVTAVELLEHIPTDDVPQLLANMAAHADWGLFVINARTNPMQNAMESHGDHGHLNNHTITWWMEQFAHYGTLDHDAMFEFSKAAEAYNPSVHWHNRCIVIKFGV